MSGGRPRLTPEAGDRVPFGLRTTPKLRQLIEQAAAESGRSMSQEAEFRLEQSFANTEFEQRLRILETRCSRRTW